MDQFLCAPVFIGSKTKVVNVVICITDSFLVFFSAQGLLEGKSVNEIKEKLQQGYTTAVLANYKVIIQIVNHAMYSPTYPITYNSYGQQFSSSISMLFPFIIVWL